MNKCASCKYFHCIDANYDECHRYPKAVYTVPTYGCEEYSTKDIYTKKNSHGRGEK